ncbi:MAG TPA: isochorismatase family cysteine hydrolase [Chloroflexota bacterium]|nr:isochorismatase family cysteine hydrolase [Chloroflexota bacterium]
MANLNLDRSRTALLCLDMHNIIVQRVPEDRRGTLVETVRRVLDAARAAGVLVIYVAVARRREFMSPRNRFTGATGFVTDPAQIAEAMKFVERVAPRDDEPIVRKPRISAFYGTELQSMLASRDIDTIVLTGVATNFVVESTARYGGDADYRVIVLEDCCGAFSHDEHDCAINAMSHFVEIGRSQDFLDSIR